MIIFIKPYVDFNELYRNVTIHCPSFSFSEIDLSQLLYSFWRIGIIMCVNLKESDDADD